VLVYKLEFDIAAFVILTALIAGLLIQKRFATRNFRACFVLILDLFFSVLLNLITSYTLVHNYDLRIFNYAVTMIQAFLSGLFPIFFLIFIHTSTHDSRRISNKFWNLITFLTVLEFLLVFTTPFTHLLFIMDDTGYRHSYGYGVLYAFSFFCLFAANSEIISNHKKIKIGGTITVISFTVCSILGVAAQFFWPYIQITGFVCTISAFAAFLSLSNPGGFYDNSTGTLNKLAFKETLVSQTFSENSSAIIFKMTKTNKLKDIFGIEGRYYITRQFMAEIRTLCETNHLYYLFNDTYIILFKGKNTAAKYGEKLKDFTSSSVKIYPSVNSTNTLNYMLSGRINIINDLDMLLKDKNKNIPYSLDESISLINYIASLTQPHHYTVITDETITDFQETVRRQRIVEKAINEKNFEVFLQPIFSIKQNSFIGAEALLRLKDEDGTYIPPLSFIPEAEANGDIIKISDIMLQKTCEFINQTKLFDKGIQTVNINLSMIQCMYDGIVDHICEILDKNHISPTLIRFEITESASINDESRFARLLEEMTTRGIEYALDDYGTGYSNTAKILNHSFSEIKFDKSLIDSMAANGENEKAVQYLFDLTREKKMLSLAEGVETKEAVERLKKMGCDMIQGFYFAEPMPADDFEKFLNEHN